MNRSQCRVSHLLAAMAVLGVFLAPVGAAAQSPLSAAEAQEFLGDWNVALQTDMGPFDVTLNIRDADGQVVAQVGIPQQGTVDVTNISRSEEALILRYSMDMQGDAIPVSVNLRRDGELLRAALDFAGGMFVANGTGTRVQ